MARLPTAGEVLAAAARLLESGRPYALCTVARCEGSTPGRPGWRLLIPGVGEPVGNLGGGAFEAMATHDARELLAAGRATAEIRRYYLTEEASRGEATGMVCGGFLEVLLEVVGARPLLLVFGAGPVGRAIAQVAAVAGFELAVLDDRPEFLEIAAFPEGARLVELPREPAGEEQPLAFAVEREVSIAVVSRCWETDLAALRLVARSDLPRRRYLGLMGSRRKIARIRELLAEHGIDLETLGARAPIGLPIGGDTPGEIAVAVVAEIIAARSSA